MGVANVYESWRLGVRVFDSSVAGLGGCPYAKGATGNVATEDLVWLLHGLGASTGIDLDALVDAGVWISDQLGRTTNSRVARARLAQRPSAPAAQCA
jgi:hydroxymethylglutaryl-CoA lyase